MSRFEPNPKIYERERILFETIKNNPDLHHNAILKLIVPKFMAKTTFEKTRDSLLNKDVIFAEIHGNMKYYGISPNFELKSSQLIERNTNNVFHDLKSQIKKLDTDYFHKDIDEKIILSYSLLRNLLDTDNGFTILDSTKNPKKTLYRDEHLSIQQLIYHVMEIIRKDKDYEIICPAIMSQLREILPQNLLEK